MTCVAYCRKKLPQQSSGKARGPAAEDMLALLHQEPSKRGPQTTQGVVARVMRRMLEQACPYPDPWVQQTSALFLAMAGVLRT